MTTSVTPTSDAAAESARYNSTDHAKKYRSTVGTQDPIDADLQRRCLDDLERDGYTIVENAFDPAVMAEIRQTVEPPANRARAQPSPTAGRQAS